MVSEWLARLGGRRAWRPPTVRNNGVWSDDFERRIGERNPLATRSIFWDRLIR